MLRKSHEERLLEFLGRFYDKVLPRSDEEMFCLLLGVMIAKTTCQMTYKTTKLNFVHFPPDSPIHKVIKQEEKARMKLYEQANELVSSYIAEVKGFRRKSREFSKWHDDMRKLFDANQEEFTKKSKQDANVIMNAVFEHLMQDSMYSGSKRNQS